MSTATVERLATAISSSAVSDRVWLSSNYHCNLICAYCLTESAPKAPRRELASDRMRCLAGEARELGFTGLGVTGGEPFLRTDLPGVLIDLGSELPVVVLTNGTLFTPRLLRRVAPLAGTPVAVQISLDRPDATDNGLLRAPGNFDKVIDAIHRLVELGLEVRIATTVLSEDAGELARLCDLHRSLGVTDEHHLVRPVVRRGRAETGNLGVPARYTDLEPELTITVDGAFGSPSAPTGSGGVLDVNPAGDAVQ